MGTLSVATLLTLLDSIAAGVARFESGIGILATDANTTAKGAANNVATLVALGDSDIEADLLLTFTARAANAKASGLYGGLYGAAVQRALDRHYGAAAGLNPTLATAGKRVHPDLRKIGFQIDAPNAFCPTAVDPVASFVVTGPGAGTFTAGSDVDASLYGEANMQVKTTTVIGAADVVATLTMKKIDGTTQQKIVTIPAGSASGVTFAIGTPDADMYMGCSAITITGGTAADAFKVISVVERAVVL